MSEEKLYAEKTRLEKIRTIARHYEYDTQSRQCIEEMAELTQAINKYWRTELQCGKNLYNPWDGYMPDNSEEYYNLVEEIADGLTDEIWELIEGGIELQKENIELKKELAKYKNA